MEAQPHCGRPHRKAQQLSARRALLAAPGLTGPMPAADLVPEELRAAIVLFASLLDELVEQSTRPASR